MKYTRVEDSRFIADNHKLRHMVDENGNKQVIAGTGEVAEYEAIAKLRTLVDCYNCCNCLNCHNCFNCSYCEDCEGCQSCEYTKDSSGCEMCFDCRSCYRCVICYRISDGHKHELMYVPHADTANPLIYATDVKDAVKIPSIHQRLYYAALQPKALDMRTYRRHQWLLSWHVCNTTHCRAGWVIHLADSKGYLLAEETNNAFAAHAIYGKSSKIPLPHFIDFFATNEEALEDMRKLAELEREFELQQKRAES